MRMRRAQLRAGFTLIEVALATMIVGVGFVAMLQLYAACTMQNGAAGDITAATLLAGNVRERLADTPFDDLESFDGATYGPPIDAQGNALADMSAFAQAIDVVPVLPNKLSANSTNPNEISKGTYTGALRVTVRILRRSSPSASFGEAYRVSWVRMDH
ncbi:MAG: prepilin-type N-terminal cleavage/methylation domain-containing protein [Phycisphaeraceae bacterium]|nr:prepilin-type N-terminal cleavage/methylation domain-containing protein [Phycisphaeraceae bacterium]